MVRKAEDPDHNEPTELESGGGGNAGERTRRLGVLARRCAPLRRRAAQTRCAPAGGDVEGWGGDPLDLVFDNGRELN